jgi:hypothetical protein
VGVTADMLEPEHSGTSLPTESEAEALAACRQVERHVVLIESKKKGKFQRVSSESLP